MFLNKMFTTVPYMKLFIVLKCMEIVLTITVYLFSHFKQF